MSAKLSRESEDAAGSEQGPAVGGSTTAKEGWIWTIPNLLSGSRLIGSGVLVGLAIYEFPVAVLTLFIVLEMTDWFDGRLAIAPDQRTRYGRNHSLRVLGFYVQTFQSSRPASDRASSVQSSLRNFASPANGKFFPFR